MELILLDFRLQVLGFGSAGALSCAVAPFPFQLLLLGLAMLDRSAQLVLLAQLQKPPVPFLVLPVCQDLGKRNTTL